MTTIDKLDIGIYIQYARRTQLIEQIKSQYHLEDAASIPPQLQVLDLYPKLSEMELLLGVVPVRAPWAYFFPPPRFRDQRRSPFTFARIGPVLSSTDKEEEEEDNPEHQLDYFSCETEEEEKEKKALQRCFAQLNKINSWLSFIVGRVGQFLQG